MVFTLQSVRALNVRIWGPCRAIPRTTLNGCALGPGQRCLKDWRPHPSALRRQSIDDDVPPLGAETCEAVLHLLKLYWHVRLAILNLAGDPKRLGQTVGRG